MRYERYSMFKIPTINIVIDGWSDKKRRLMSLYEQESVERVDASDDMENLYTSFYVSNEKTENFNKNVYKILQEEIHFFAQELGFKECILNNSWFQKYENQDHHAIHTHGTLGFSFVCYVKYNPNYHKPTTFIAPFLSFIDGNCQHHHPDVNEGNILFFPSAIMHYAPPNKTNEPRVILSGNLKIKQLE